MSWKFLVVSTLLSLALVGNMLSQSYAQIAYHVTSFESIASAEIDAGEEYSLGPTGTSQPQSSSTTFELHRSNGTLVTSSSGTGRISYKGRLTAGTYTVYVGSQVLRQINGSRGDVYEGSIASYDVTLTAR